MHHIPGKFVWFEHVSHDLPQARAFYEALCGWAVESMPAGDAEPYQCILNQGTGIGGFRAAQPGIPSHWMPYLSTSDVDQAAAKAQGAGARLLMPPTDFGQAGRAAAIADPTGAVLCLWRGNMDDAADVDRTPVGGWFWNELFTKDAPAALAFYEAVFGYTHDSMDMGPQGTYHVLKTADGKPRAGMMQQPPGTPAPSHWLPYIQVADCDAAARRAAELGAKATVVPPTDIPDIGRFTVILDPLGAAIALIKGA